MSETITMPKLGLTMTEGKITRWLKKVGDHVDKDEPMVEIETDKLNAEVESPFEGYVIEIFADEGEERAITAPIAAVGEKGEVRTEPLATKEFATLGHGVSTMSSVRASADVDYSAMTGTGPVGEIQEADVEQAVENKSGQMEGWRQNSVIRMTPMARKLAEENGIDCSKLKGSGPEGRIVKEDIVKALEDNNKSTDGSTAQSSASTTQSGARCVETGDIKVALTGVRKIIAQKMSQSKREIPHVYFKVKVDASEILRLRDSLSEAIKAKTGRKLSVNEIVIKAVAATLREFPELNASLTNDEISYHTNINIGMAVSIEKGLIVPVIPHVDRLGFLELNMVAGDLATRAREGKLSLDEISGGTFTVSNLGASGIEEFTAIINPPESAILAVGKAVQTAVVENGQVVVRPVMALTLSVDHRIIDGSLAARFMAKMKVLMENPFLLLV